MNPENIKNSIQAVIDGLTPLAQKLQIPIEGLFGWALKNNYAIAVTNLIPLIPLIIFMVLLFRAIPKSKWNEKSPTNVEAYLVIFYAIFAIISLIASVACLTSAINRVIAPEWNASNDIINMIHKI